MPKEQLCWTCQNACSGCSWSASLTPVKGWTATPSSIKSEGKEVPTYHIEECPLYISDWDKPVQRKKFQHLTRKEKQMISDLYKSGMKKTDIAKKLNFSYMTVKKYSHFSWRDKE